MADPIFWRLIWKEYRTQRAFWLSVFGFALLLQLIGLYCFVTVRPQWRLAEFVDYCFGIAMLFPVFFAVGTGAVSFASEWEDGTNELLQRISAPPGRLFASKLGFGVTAILLMYGVLSCLAWAFSRGELPFTVQNSGSAAAVGVFVRNYASSILFAMGFLLWGMFFSLLVKHVLAAVCLGGVATFVSSYALTNAPWFALLYGTARVDSVFVMACQAGILSIVILAVDFWLAQNWLLRGWNRVWFEGEETSTKVNVTRSVEAEVEAPVAPWRREMKRLIWQEWRYARKVAACIAGGGFLLLHYLGESYKTWGEIEDGLPASYLIVFVPILLGVFSFRNEQRGRRFRFLAERGVSPRVVWLSKHLVWLPLALLVSLLFILLSPPAVRQLLKDYVNLHQAASYWDAVALSTVSICFDERIPRGHAAVAFQFLIHAWWTPLVPFLLVAALYAAGQFASMLIASAVTATLLGVFLGSILLAWFRILLALDVPLVFSVAPLPIVLLLTTLVRSRDWMLERNTAHAWGKVAAVCCVPCSLIVAGAIVFRIYEIPAVPKEERDLVHEQMPKAATSEERETAHLYDAITGSISTPPPRRRGFADQPPRGFFPAVDWNWTPPGPAMRQWVEGNEAEIEQVLEITKREACAFLDPETVTLHDFGHVAKLSSQCFKLVKLLVSSAQALEADGRLDVALDRYLAALQVGKHLAQKGSVAQFLQGCHLNEYVYYWMNLWATHPGQTAEQLKIAIDRLSDHAATLADPLVALNVQYTAARRTIHQRSVADFPILAEYLTFSQFVFSWEWTRLLRQLDLLNHIEYYVLAEFDWTFRQSGKSMTSWVKDPLAFSKYPLPDIWAQLWREPKLGYVWRQQTYHGIPAPLSIPTRLAPNSKRLITGVLDAETRRRALTLTFAAMAWRLEHRELPRSLDELIGTHFDGLPLDPWSGRPFSYRPDGLPTRLRVSNGMSLPANRPFLWSVSQWDARILPGERQVIERADGTKSIRMLSSSVINARGNGILVDSKGHIDKGISVWRPAEYDYPLGWDVGPEFYGGIIFPIPDS